MAFTRNFFEPHMPHSGGRVEDLSFLLYVMQHRQDAMDELEEGEPWEISVLRREFVALGKREKRALRKEALRQDVPGVPYDLRLFLHDNVRHVMAKADADPTQDVLWAIRNPCPICRASTAKLGFVTGPAHGHGSTRRVALLKCATCGLGQGLRHEAVQCRRARCCKEVFWISQQPFGYGHGVECISDTAGEELAPNSSLRCVGAYGCTHCCRAGEQGGYLYCPFCYHKHFLRDGGDDDLFTHLYAICATCEDEVSDLELED